MRALRDDRITRRILSRSDFRLMGDFDLSRDTSVAQPVIGWMNG